MKKGVALVVVLAFVMSLFVLPGMAFAAKETQNKSNAPHSPVDLNNLDESKKVKINNKDVPFELPKVRVESEKGKTKLKEQEYFLLYKGELDDGGDYYLIEINSVVETVDDYSVLSGGTKAKTVTKNYQNLVSGSQTTWIEVTGTHLDHYVRILRMQYQWQRSNPRYNLQNAKAVAQMWGYNVNGQSRQYRWDGPVSPSFNAQGFTQTFNSYNPMQGWNPIKTVGPMCFTSTMADIYDGNTKLVDRVNFQCFVDVHNWPIW